MSEGSGVVGDQKPEHVASLPPKVTDKYLFFCDWKGPHPEIALSQWYPSPFYDPDASGGYNDDDDDDNPKDDAPRQQFHTAEQYMMYWKALLMGDDEMVLKIADCKTPAEAKTYGRQVKNFDREVWKNNCDTVVERGNLFKFSQNEKLKQILLDTGERQLVETSPDDRIWGIGFDAEKALGNEDKWGENKLGKALMRVREQLKEKSKP